METIIQDELKGFTYKRCGECCKQEGLLADAFTEEDWALIIDYVLEKSDGVLEIKVEGATKPVERKQICLTSVKDIYESKEAWIQGDCGEAGEIWDVLDLEVCCHFLRYKIKHNKREYYCEIEHIKPFVYAAYKCNNDNSIKDDNEHKKITKDFEERKKNLEEQRRRLLKT